MRGPEPARQRVGVGLDVRQLAAIDIALHGPGFIVTEFLVGVGGCGALGIFSVVHALGTPHPIGWQLALGVELIFIALNYIPLLVHALSVRRDAAERERTRQLIETDHEQVRRTGLRQAWIVVPLAVVVFALTQARGGASAAP